MATELKHPQRSPEWFAARAGRVTASSVAKVLAKIKTGEAADRKNYKAQLVVERLTGKPAPSGYTNAAMQRGTDLEPEARMEVEARMEILVVESGFWIADDLMIGASPDGLIDDDGILEIKVPSLATHMDYVRNGGLPAEYRPQVQFQLEVTGRKWCQFVSYAPEFPEHLQLHSVRVERDDDFIKTMMDEVKLFLVEVDQIVEQLSKKAA